MTIVVNSPVAGIGFAGTGGVSLVYPTILAQSAIPFILAGGTGGTGTQFTISATGALSTLPTLPFTSGNAFVYMPTGITGLASGWYYALIQSATTAQLYTATYTSGDPRLAVPASPVAPSGITAGSYSQTTGSNIIAHQITVPGGTMGPNGSFRYTELLSWSAATTQNIYQTNFGALNLISNGLAVNTPNTGIIGMTQSLFNVNSASRQVFNPFISDAANQNTVSPTYGSLNTGADVTFDSRLQLGAASNFAMINALRLEVMYGA